MTEPDLTGLLLEEIRALRSDVAKLQQQVAAMSAVEDGQQVAIQRFWSETWPPLAANVASMKEDVERLQKKVDHIETMEMNRRLKLAGAVASAGGAGAALTKLAEWFFGGN